MQPRGAAAHLALGEGALDAVALVDLHEVLADRWVLVLDQAGGEHRHLALGLGDRAALGARPLLEPSREALAGEGREQALAGNADRLLHEPPRQRTRGGDGGVGERGGETAGELAQQVGAAEGGVLELVATGELTVAGAGLLGAQHEAGEVEVPLALARDVRAVHVAELAVEAFVDDLVLLGRAHATGVLVVVPVDVVEERRERRAELEAQATAVAQVVDPGQLLAHVDLVEVLRVERVVRRRHGSEPRGDAVVGAGAPDGDRSPAPGGLPEEAARRSAARCEADQRASRPSPKRPAWLFSARASVSSHSAISAKPSSRAVLAKPGYISVYS